MDDANAPGATPEPVTARSLGLLNIIFGALFLLGNGYEAGVVLALPFYGRLMDWGQSMARQQQDERRRALMDRFDQQIEEAESDEGRERVEAERTVAEMNDVGDLPMMEFPMDFLDRPDVRNGVLAKLGVMGSLNVLLIASGFGLTWLRGWGRGLGRAVALLMIPAVLAFLTMELIAAPSLAGGWTDGMSEMILGPGASPSPAFAEAIDLYRQGATRVFAFSIATTGSLALLYPILVLVVASRPGVGLAVRRPTPAP
ncbi:hypothetical protein [Tautonia plasticadhaerens]|uniref:Uncharacterized protein n=1 Tax=Tautonia plasticadhaerens TaxID=2527974 RepID=A0A518GZX5_9BACT|nr:hypothetical protein [Tautonia plasticadhaerens]QDV34124.1 hypothetical protein ElP_20070 [Tautonia plasticadhaerens]